MHEKAITLLLLVLTVVVVFLVVVLGVLLLHPPFAETSNYVTVTLVCLM